MMKKAKKITTKKVYQVYQISPEGLLKMAQDKDSSFGSDSFQSEQECIEHMEEQLKAQAWQSSMEYVVLPVYISQRSPTYPY